MIGQTISHRSFQLLLRVFRVRGITHQVLKTKEKRTRSKRAFTEEALPSILPKQVRGLRCIRVRGTER